MVSSKKNETVVLRMIYKSTLNVPTTPSACGGTGSSVKRSENWIWSHPIPSIGLGRKTTTTNKLSKVIGILNRLKHVYPQNALLSIYHSLFATHLNYGLLLWDTHVNRVSKLQEKLSESCVIANI